DGVEGLLAGVPELDRWVTGRGVGRRRRRVVGRWGRVVGHRGLLGLVRRRAGAHWLLDAVASGVAGHAGTGRADDTVSPRRAPCERGGREPAEPPSPAGHEAGLYGGSDGDQWFGAGPAPQAVHGRISGVSVPGKDTVDVRPHPGLVD